MWNILNDLVKPLWEAAQCWKETIKLLRIAEEASLSTDCKIEDMKAFVVNKRYFRLFSTVSSLKKFSFLVWKLHILYLFSIYTHHWNLRVSLQCWWSADFRGILRPAMDMKNVTKLNDVMSLSIWYIAQILVIWDLSFLLIIFLYVIFRTPGIVFLAAE